MLRSVLYRLIFSILLLIASTASTLWFVINKDLIPFLLSALTVIISIIYILRLYTYNTRKITFMFSAVDNDDYMFRFAENGSFMHDNLFNMALNRVKELLLKAKTDAMKREKYYELILDRVITGIVVMNSNGNVLQTNKEALRLLEVPKLNHVNQLERIDETLPSIFISVRAGENISVKFHTERGTANLSLQASESEIKDNDLKIIAINDIERQMDEKELESWIRLTQVLTHEIINAVTPITSLSDTLFTMYGDKEDDFYKGLEAINYTGKGLIAFVDSYRSFTRIPPPEIQKLDASKFIERIAMLAKEYVGTRNILISIAVESEDLVIEADENQITQVILNVLKNAVAAIDEDTDGLITIKAYSSDDGYTAVEISNNGKPIPREETEHIFVPFFSTKENGSGIGLSVARQIMRLHKGHIKLKDSNNKETIFALKFRNYGRHSENDRTPART
ncbi:MAG: GHKL domain-containing protein [Rikenellaceae bacterium]|nr:GHKL domain-containing protein [Rikenellaceae bacterium]